MNDAAQSLTALARYMGETSGPEWTQVMADGTLRLTGLNKVTEMGQHAAGTEALRWLGMHRELAWDALPGDLRDALERSGIENYDWQQIRTARPIESGGVDHVDPHAIGDRQVADRLMGYVLRYRAAAVQEATMKSRTATNMKQRAGTIKGEAVRSMVQFKGFAVGMLLKQGSLMAALGPRRAAVYGARFFIGMTIAGAVQIQVRELLKGNDPLPMDTVEFWERAALQGGGVGVLGDLLSAVTDPRIGTIGAFVAGPTASDIETLKRAFQTATPGDLRKDGTRRDAQPASAAIMVGGVLMPGGNAWYVRAAWERLVIDGLRAEVDETHEARMALREGRLNKEGRSAWWPSGGGPQRAPDWRTALGGEYATELGRPVEAEDEE